MLSRRVEKAIAAYRRKDISEARKVHEKKIIEESIHADKGGKYIGDLVYGGIDGIVTTFAVVSGVAGASLSSSIVLILGFANLFADGLSMAVGNYLGSKSEAEYHEQERKREEWEIENVPEGEIEEIRQIFSKKGFKGKDLERATEIITSNKKVWVETMMVDELGLTKSETSPIKSGAATFLAFVVAGFFPLFSYVLSYFVPFFKENAFVITIILTGVALFLLGSARVYITGKKWWIAGFEILFVGGIAAVVAYFIGFLLQGLA